MSPNRDDVPARRDDAVTAEQIGGALERVGLRATPETIAALVGARRKADLALDRLKDYLDPRTEPANVFRAGGGDAEARGGDDGERR